LEGGDVFVKKYVFALFGVVMLMGFGLFHLKYHVVQLEQKLTFVQRKIAQKKEAIHVLKAEWSHLNEPSRLQKLVQKHLDMTPITAFQLISSADLSGIPEDKTAPTPSKIPDIFFTRLEGL
jgi:cell division protein FtsL